MARLPMMSGDEFVKVVHKAGFVLDHTEGSHMILLHPSGMAAFCTQTQGIGTRFVEGFN